MKNFFLSVLFLIFLSAPANAFEKEFNPAWWCRGAHCQTIAGAFLRPSPDLPFERERIELPDGDFLDLDWLRAPGNEKHFVIVLPGLGSNSSASYVHTLLDEVKKLGWNAVVINARGTTEMNRNKETSNAGKTEDLDFVVQKITAEHQEAQIFLVGYSLGGNALLKWLGEKKEAVPASIKRSTAVSVPYDLQKTSTELSLGFNRQYARFMLRSLIRYAIEKEKQFPGALDLSKVTKADTFEIYDREVTARLNGFRDERDYWEKSSAKNYLTRIRKPVLLIHAANDPFLPALFLPTALIRANPNLTLHVTPDGGHIGFVGDQERWLEKTITDYLGS